MRGTHQNLCWTCKNNLPQGFVRRDFCFPEKSKPKKKEIYEIKKTQNTNWKQKVKRK